MRIELKDGDLLQPFGFVWSEFDTRWKFPGGFITKEAGEFIIASGTGHVERPEPPKPKQVEFVGHLANYHLFPDRFEITLSGTGDWYDIMPRGPVTAIVRREGEPLELPFTVTEMLESCARYGRTPWQEWIPQFFAKYGLKCKGDE